MELGAPVEDERQARSRDLVKAATCVARANVVPRAGVEGLERVVAGAFRVAGASVGVVAVGAAAAVDAAGSCSYIYSP